MGPYTVYTVRNGRLHQTSTRIKSIGLASAWAGLLKDEPWMVADSQGIEVEWSKDWPVGHRQCQQCQDAP